MMRHTVLAAALAAVVGFALPAAAQQQNPGYFIPGQQHAPAAPHRAAPPPEPVTPAPMPAPILEEQPPASLSPHVQLPPAPALPELPRGASPPAAVLGVIGVPEVMRASTAAQQVEKIINERRQKLNEDVQKEQNVWREMQQGLATDRGKLSAEQIRVREHELQDRITKAQQEFRKRADIIQQAAQYGLAQIERTLIGVIQRVAESRSMNMVLHRQQVALNVNEFDITDEVATELNKILPSVVVPADGKLPPTAPAESGKSGPAPAPAKPPAGKK
jgi:Skp family chaperone for outer membrane proteins